MELAGLQAAEAGNREAASVHVPLDRWMATLDTYLQERLLEEAAIVLRGLLIQRPLHLPAYERALSWTWQAGHFGECRSLALRLLHADPLNRTACGVLARVAEVHTRQTGEIYQAWQRLWQMYPFNPQFRKRWQTVHGNLELDLPALGFTHMHSRHWAEAIQVFAELKKNFPERGDWRTAWLISQWRGYRRAEALDAARIQVDRNRHLLAGWHILSLLGDQADQAIAQTYIRLLDPDGSFTQDMLGFGFVPVGSMVPQLAVPDTNRMLRHCLHLEE